MKLRLLAIAAGLAAVSSAHALTPAQIADARTAGTLKEVTFSGASALRLSLAAYIQEICDTNTMHVFFNNAAGANHRAYSCNLGVAVGNYPAGTPVLVTKRDQGGSGQGVAPIALNTPIAHMNVDASCVVTATPNFTDIQVPNYTCGTTSNRVSDAGISDVEPGLLNATINLADNTPGDPTSGPSTPVDLSSLDVKPFVQGIFGVAVNLRAYRALQATQGLTQDDSDANRPSLPTTWVRGALTGGLTASNASQRGWGLVISPAVDASVHTKTLNICRRQPSSGTQAASNAYFAQNPCGLSTTNALRQASAAAPVHTATGGTYVVNEGAGTGNVETCIGTTVENIAGAYAIGVLGRENNPLANGGDKKYRYVKLDGAQPLRYDASTGRGAIYGDYDFVYESTLQYNTTNPNLNADKIAFIAAIRSGAPKPASLAKADADTQQGVMAPSSTWAPAQYPALPAADKPFASRVGRTAGDSCSVLKLAR